MRALRMAAALGLGLGLTAGSVALADTAQPAAAPGGETVSTRTYASVPYRPVSAFARAEAARLARNRIFARSAACPPGAPILYRGNLICVRGR